MEKTIKYLKKKGSVLVIFTPQFYDIFLSRRREWLADKFSKGESRICYLKMLKKITLKQALLRDVFSFRTDIAKYTDKIFGACVFYFLKNNRFLSTSLNGSGIFYTDVTLYELLIFELLYSGFKNGYCKIEFEFCNGFVILRTFPCQLSKAAIKLTSKLKGIIIHKENSVWVKIPNLSKTDYNAPKRNETDRINDPFSPINYYFV